MINLRPAQIVIYIYIYIYICIISLFAWIIAVTQLNYYHLDINGRYYSHGLLNIFIALLGCLCFIQFSQSIESFPLIGRILAFFGKNSMLFMCIHGFELKYSQYIFYKALNYIHVLIGSNSSNLNIFINIITRLLICIIGLLIAVLIKNLLKTKNKFVIFALSIITMLLLIIPNIIKYSVNQLENQTDINWTNGVRNDGIEILVKNNLINHQKYINKTPMRLCINGEYYSVVSIIEDENGYIRIEMENNEIAQKFAYPAKFSIIYGEE